MNKDKSITSDKIVHVENVEVIPFFDTPDADSPIDRSAKDIPLTKIVELRRKGLSLQQIADICKCSKQNIHMRLRDCEDFEKFSEDTATHFEVLQHRIYKSIDDNDIKRTPFAQRVITLGILEDKKASVRNRTPQNVDVFALMDDLKNLEEAKKALVKEMRAVLKASTNESHQ